MNEKDLKINCQCGYKEIVTIETYMNQLNALYNSISPCELCKSKHVSFQYCNKCKKWLCIDCIDFFHKCDWNSPSNKDYNPKKTVKLFSPLAFIYYNRNFEESGDVCCFYCRQYINFSCCKSYSVDMNKRERYFGDKISDYLYQYRIAVGYLDNVYTKMYNQTLDYLNSKIKALKTAYEKNKKENQIKLDFIATLYTNYELLPKRLNNIMNIIENCHFNLYPILKQNETIANNIDNIINYYQTFSIIKKKESIDLNCILSTNMIKHKEKITSILELTKGYLVTGTLNGIIRIYNHYELFCLSTKQAHKGSILDLSNAPNDTFISSSADQTFKIWKGKWNNNSLSGQFFRQYGDIVHYSCIQTVKAHNDCVLQTFFLNDNNCYVSCTYNQIKFWSKHSFRELNYIMCNFNTIGIIKPKDNNIIISGSNSIINSLIFWNTNTYEKERVINNTPCSSKQSLIVINKKLVVGNRNKIYIIDLCSYQIESTYYDNSLGLVKSIIILRNDTVVCISENKKILQIEMTQGKIIYRDKLPLFSDTITSMMTYSNNRFIVLVDNEYIEFFLY